MYFIGYFVNNYNIVNNVINSEVFNLEFGTFFLLRGGGGNLV